MAKMRSGLYLPDKEEVVDGRFTPDPKVSGQWFEPDGKGGGTLYVIRRRMRPGFRKPIEEKIAIRKEAHFSPAEDHGDDEHRASHSE